VVIGFQWLGDEIAYPPPGPGEDTNAIGPVAPYFDKVGYQIHGDTFPMTWANDDEIYTSAGDPGWGGKNEGLDVERFFGMPPLRKAVTDRTYPMNLHLKTSWAPLGRHSSSFSRLV
jgi:hypothetical protein